MASERIQFLDVSKVICTFLVVFGHFIDNGEDPVRIHIYTFHMPFFFLVSGLFHKYNGSIQIVKYLKTIIIPAFFFSLLTILVESVEFYLGSDWGSLDNQVLRGDTWIGTFLNMLLFEITHPWRFNYDGVCWFLGALFWCKLFTDCIEKKKIWIPVFLVFLLVPSVKLLHDNQAFCIVQGTKAFVFYYLAYKFKNNILSFCNSPKALCYGVFSIIVMLILTHFNGRVSLLGLKAFGKLPLPFNIVVFYINAVVGSLGIIILSKYIRVNKTLTSNLGNSLITIVGAQSIFFDGYLRVCGLPNPSYCLNAVLSIIIIIICYYLHCIFDKFCPVLIGKIKR